MRLLLTGKSGQVGFELQRALAPIGELIAMDRTGCDLENEASIRAVVREIKPDVIVNAAAYTAVDKAERDKQTAYAVNAQAPAILGEEAARFGALVVHYSTDYVFDGKAHGYYRENDPVGPQSVYGETKLLGEQALAASGSRHVIFRTSWVFAAYGANFAKSILRLASERDTFSVVGDQVGAPTSAALIADVSAHIIRKMDTINEIELEGIYHLVAGGEASWHDYACYVIEYARAMGHTIKVAPDAIMRVSTSDYPTPAKRPANSKLDTQKLRDTFGLTLPDWKSGLEHILHQIL